MRQLAAAREALAANDIPTARKLLQACQKASPRSAEVQYLAGQAARRDGALDEARERLNNAAQLGWVPEAISFERALLAVQQGEGEGYLGTLHRWVEEHHPEASRILEILVPYYLLRFQVHDASWAARAWVEAEPERAQAWVSKGMVAERQRNATEAIEAFRRAVELNPQADEARLMLVRWLLEKNQPEEAGKHLALLVDHRPSDSQVLYFLARQQTAQGEASAARQTLERLLAAHPKHAGALAERGRLKLAAGEVVEAEADLLRAAELAPYERDILYQLTLCLRRLNKDTEARTVEKRRLALEADLDRLGKITQDIARSPGDPELRREAGEICLRQGRIPDGLNWLNSALRENPRHPATHRTLAQHYQMRGQVELARRHAQLAGMAPSSGKE
ncbi:MAG: tetratricopeptide repeat protein [Gemmataceae bacterium]